MRMQDPFEPTPAQFHFRVEQKLSELQRPAQPAARSHRWIAVMAACLVLLCGTALALEQLGVLHFLTDRIWQGDPVNAAAIVQPAHQQCDSRLLDASVRDAYWDGETLSVAVHIRPKGDYAFYTETDRGQDGEHFEQIWWNGEILSFETWKAGRAELKLSLPKLMDGTENITTSWDWVQDEQGETMLIQGACEDLTQGAALAIELEALLEGESGAEHATLTFTLPPMTKGEVEE